MGKGQIISGGTDGQYQVKILYSTVEYYAELEKIEARLILLNAAYNSAPTDTIKERFNKSVIGLQIAAVEKRKTNLEENIITDKDISAWCADLTEDLTGNVGTIEVPGESTHIQIQPGFENNAAYDGNRDGQLVQTYNMISYSAFYNLALLPGWQKWKPLFRYAVINSIDTDNDTADITFEDIKSSQQELEINQTETLSGVGIEYMTCDSFAFEVGDEVLVKFENQNWNTPKIIGFKDYPKNCNDELVLIRGTVSLQSEPHYCTVWNPITEAPSDEIPLNSGGFASFPCLYSEISDWIGDKTDDIGSSVYWNPFYLAQGRPLGGLISGTPDCDDDCPGGNCSDSVGSGSYGYHGGYAGDNSCGRTTVSDSSNPDFSKSTMHLDEDFNAHPATINYNYKSFNDIYVGTYGSKTAEENQITKYFYATGIQSRDGTNSGTARHGGPLGEVEVEWDTSYHLGNTSYPGNAIGTVMRGPYRNAGDGVEAYRDAIIVGQSGPTGVSIFDLVGVYGEHTVIYMQSSVIRAQILDAGTEAIIEEIVEKDFWASFNYYEDTEDLNDFDPRTDYGVNASLTNVCKAIHEIVKLNNTYDYSGTRLYSSILRVNA